MLEIKKIKEIDDSLLECFFSECRKLKYINNVSKKSIKLDWALNTRKGQFFVALLNNKVLAMAGCHWMPELENTYFRIQFRACELPYLDIKTSLSRGHFNSITFREMILCQLQWMKEQGDYVPCISVNYGHRNHRAMQLMEKQGFLTYLEDRNLFGVDQTLWTFNSDHYIKIRKQLKSYAK